MVSRITGREPRSQPAASGHCRLSDFQPPQLSVLQPPLTSLDHLCPTARRYPSRERLLVRRSRLRLARVRYYVYYWLLSDPERIEILAFWQEGRGSGPSL